MSAFDTALACARNMHECIIQNHFETPPYGPIPDAEGKLRLAVNGMIDALLIGLAAESQGILMPPLTPQPPEGDELEALKARVRQEHTLHREYAEALRDLPAPPDPRPLGELPPPEEEQPDLARRERERREQEEAARHPQGAPGELPEVARRERERQEQEQAQRREAEQARQQRGPQNTII